MAPRPHLRPLLLAASVTAVGCASATAATSAEREGAPPAAASLPPGRWIDTAGTTTLGFGVLRVTPPAGAATARFRVRFHDFGDGYSSDATSAALVVLPGDAFAKSESAYADCWRAFGRGTREDGKAYSVDASADFTADGDRIVLVAYGPWEGPDVGRPPSDRHSFTLEVEPLDDGFYRWVESEAGEIITTSWTSRPGVARGGPATDPLTGKPVWIESRILVLYDDKSARPADLPAATEEERERMPLRPDLYALLSKVPIRWR